MTYKMNNNGTTYYIEAERHSYRIRFYAIEVVHSGSESDGNGGFIPCQWNRLGYIGSYMPGSHTCGYSHKGLTYNAAARGPKTAARQCLAWFADNVLVAA